MKLKALSEQVILITGASSGIGLVTARHAARKGARVVLVARNEGALQKIAAEIEAEGGKALAVAADVGDVTQLAAAAEQAIVAFGRIDTWVNDAGVAIYGRLVDTPDDEHRKLFETNYFGMVHGCCVAVRHLRERGGALITIGSIASDLPSPVLGAYAASKHAIKAYVEALRMELHADDVPISVTLIKPSGIDTPIAQHAANHGPGRAFVPPPVYAPELVADAILYAAEHPRRTITVGGKGRAQVLVGQYFPWLVDKLTPLMRRVLFDVDRAKVADNALVAPARDGRERSGEEVPQKRSLYTAIELHPVKAVCAIAIAVALASTLRASRQRQGLSRLV
ncbi:MAG: SDR family oxidoreductase [Sphingomonas sp.]